MKNLNITKIAIVLAVGIVAYKVFVPKEEKKSNFSSACGCGA